MRQFVASALIAVTALSTPAFAGEAQHVVDPSVLADTVARHAAAKDADRAAIHAALAQPEVQNIAQTMGLDLEHAHALVDTLSGAELDEAAAAARQVNDSLAGGGLGFTSIVIILLLVIILVIVAVH